MTHRYRKRHLLSSNTWEKVEAESNVLLFTEGRPTGFDIATESTEEISLDLFTYRGVTYHLTRTNGDEAARVWTEHLDERIE